MTYERSTMHAPPSPTRGDGSRPEGWPPSATLGTSRVRRTTAATYAITSSEDGHRVDAIARVAQLVGGDDRAHVGERRRRDAPVREAQHHGLVGRRRIPDVDLGEEAVELGLGEGVGALVLDRVLCRDDEERRRKRMRHPVDTDLTFLHRFE